MPDKRSKTTYPVMYNWSSGGPMGSAPRDMGQAMCSNESRTITSQAVTCVVPVHSDTRSHRTNRPRLPRFLRLNMVIVSSLCCWLLLLPPLPGITRTDDDDRLDDYVHCMSCDTIAKGYNIPYDGLRKMTTPPCSVGVDRQTYPISHCCRDLQTADLVNHIN